MQKFLFWVYLIFNKKKEQDLLWLALCRTTFAAIMANIFRFIEFITLDDFRTHVLPCFQKSFLRSFLFFGEFVFIFLPIESQKCSMGFITSDYQSQFNLLILFSIMKSLMTHGVCLESLPSSNTNLLLSPNFLTHSWRFWCKIL